MTFTRQELADQAASLAVQGVYIGTSSWKYPGWCGTVCDRARHEYRGKFAETRFKRDCLAEYAEVFKTVCVDAAYYISACSHIRFIGMKFRLMKFSRSSGSHVTATLLSPSTCIVLTSGRQHMTIDLSVPPARLQKYSQKGHAS